MLGACLCHPYSECSIRFSREDVSWDEELETSQSLTVCVRCSPLVANDTDSIRYSTVLAIRQHSLRQYLFFDSFRCPTIFRMQRCASWRGRYKAVGPLCRFSFSPVMQRTEKVLHMARMRGSLKEHMQFLGRQERATVAYMTSARAHQIMACKAGQRTKERHHGLCQIRFHS